MLGVRVCIRAVPCCKEHRTAVWMCLYVWSLERIGVQGLGFSQLSEAASVLHV